MIAVFAGLLVCAHAYALSLEVFAMAAGLLAVMYILYFRVSPKYGYVLVLTPHSIFAEDSICDSADAWDCLADRPVWCR